MRTIVTVVGARPQFVKAAPVSRVLRQTFREVLVHTGQHYDHNMAGVFFEELNIPKPDYNLDVGSGSHGRQTGEMLIRLEEAMQREKPDAILVYGDTNSTLAGALAGSKLHIPVFHVEAGLRSFNKAMPEEINRVMTDHVSSLLFAPTATAVRNLELENIRQGVHLVGDVMYDAVLYNMRLAQQQVPLSRFGLEDTEYFLATIHRAENTDRPERLKAIAEQFMRLERLVVLPLHPRTEKQLKQLQLWDDLAACPYIRILPPVSYLEMLLLESRAAAIITDSGGVQKEAYFAQVPCVTMRDETEWTETVETGWNVLMNPERDDLRDKLRSSGNRNYVPDLYGDGQASEKIVQHIMEYFS